MSNQIITLKRKIIDLYNQKHDYEKSFDEINGVMQAKVKTSEPIIQIKGTNNYVRLLQQHIRLNVHNWMYHDKLNKICALKTTF